MLPLRILGANGKITGKNLPGLSVKYNNNVFYSAWEPTPEDLVLLNNGGKVILACAGIQPYVVLKAIETDLEYADYKTPYTIKIDQSEPDWNYMSYKKPSKKGRPKKVKDEKTN